MPEHGVGAVRPPLLRRDEERRGAVLPGRAGEDGHVPAPVGARAEEGLAQGGVAGLRGQEERRSAVLGQFQQLSPLTQPGIIS